MTIFINYPLYVGYSLSSQCETGVTNSPLFLIGKAYFKRRREAQPIVHRMYDFLNLKRRESTYLENQN
jgi:hypothetical protein